MWNGYFRVKKSTEFVEADKISLKGMGQQTGKPNEITCVRYSLDNKQAIIEGIFDSEPIEDDVLFELSEFKVFAGVGWSEMRTSACVYICANSADWEE